MRSITYSSSLIIAIFFIASSCSSSGKISGSGTSAQNVTAGETSNSAEGRDGMSFETAIIVKSIKSEYEWIQLNYPGSTVQMQALVRKNGKPYDVLTFVTADGRTRKAHFDISKFFGKGF